MNPSDERNDRIGEWPDADTRERADQYLHLLTDRYRREVLRALDREEAVFVDDIAERIDDADAEFEDEREAATALYHVHIPKLADGGLVEFDPDERRVEKGDWPPFVDDVLTRVEKTR